MVIMLDTYHRIGDKTVYIRHNQIFPGRPALLFVHGLGDSGLSFGPAFEDRRFDEFNLLVPDLMGYGRSSAATDPGGYTFDAHLRRLWRIVHDYNLHELILIGHSMGGDITALMCRSDTDGRIKKYVNIEGALTQHDLFLSGNAAQAVEEERFDAWFENFVNETAWSWGETLSGRI